MPHNNQQEITAPLRAAIYLRYSCDMSRPASLEDQERTCRAFAESKGWTVLDDYVRGDAAKTGRTLASREALASLLEESQMKPRPFDVLITDECSRIARKLKDVLDVSDRLKFDRVKIAFVGQNLVSDDPGFETMLTFYGMMDQQNSDRLRHRVRRGQEGRVRKGYSSGSRCFGYRSVLEPDPNKPWAQDRADMLGTRWHLIQSEAETIRKIYDLYADGMSVYHICLKFNEEKIPASRKPRIGSCETAWNTNLIKGILQNEKYIGKIIWNKTFQEISPRNGKTQTRKNPADAWVRVDAPHLRIVTDEQWNRVQERLKIVNEKMTRRRIGGLNRAKKRDYLFSGLLKCGICGSSMNITASHSDHRSATYLCVSARYKRGCTNRLYIREDRLSAQLVDVLAQHLLTPPVIDYFVEAVSKEFDAYLKSFGQNGTSPLTALKKRADDLERGIKSLLGHLKDPALLESDALRRALVADEAELKKVRTEIQLAGAPQGFDDIRGNIDKLVRNNMNDLLEVLKQDVLKAKQMLPRHIKHLTLFPTETETGPGYEVLGELDLFVPASDREKRILLDRSFIPTIQQYTDYLLRFFGPHIYVKGRPEEHPLLDALTSVLQPRPDLLHTPQTLTQWTHLIRTSAGSNSDLSSRVSINYVSSHLRDRADVLVRRLGMVEIRHGRALHYMFARAGAA